MEEKNIKKISRKEFLQYAIIAAGTFPLIGLNGETGIKYNPDAFAGNQDIEKWKWKIQAKYYSKSGNTVQCNLCPNLCRIRNGQTGLCQTRINVEQTLYAVNYGNPCAVHIDPIEKKPFFHFLPATSAFSIATAGCSLACLNCQNWSISQASPFNTDNIDLMPEMVVKKAVAAQCSSIAYTYSEPMVFYEYALDTCKLARKAGLKNIFKTSGYINQKPLLELIPFTDAVNIDLKSFSNDIYQRLNAGSLKPVLNTLLLLKKNQIWVEITNLVIPQWTDDMKMIREMCKWLNTNGFSENPIHFSRFSPMYKLSQLPPTPASVLNNACETARSEGLKYVYIGNYPSLGAENTICPECGKTVIERQGFTVKSVHIKNSRCIYCNHQIAGVWNS